jgi:ABC-type sugar transport system ATPase subunit
MVEARQISKSYGGVKALDGVSFVAAPGRVHALLGENGAGKSTLIKVIVGAARPDSGSLLLDGNEVSFASTADAAKHGVAVVSQELSLFPELDVLSNMFPMREPRRGPFISRGEMEAKARPVLRELGLDISPRAFVGTLPLAQRQLVEIAKAMVTDPRVLILDEPTSALEAESVNNLIRVLRALRERSVAVVFVSHILEEVMALCDEVTVLRDGCVALDRKARADLTVPAIVEAMLGDRKSAEQNERAAARGVKRARTAVGDGGEVMARGTLELEHVEVGGRLHDVSLTVAPGEIVGLAGLAGAGHQVLLELLSGLRRASAGDVRLPDGGGAPRNPTVAFRRGVALVSGDRRRVGLMLDKPLWDNIGQVRAVALGRYGHFIRKRELRQHAGRYVNDLGIRPGDVDALAGQLSGGNQQKVVFAKWLNTRPSLLLLDDPSRGVDVGAKAEMYELIEAVSSAGAIVLMCSTDADELVDVCQRVIVLQHGRVAASLSGDGLDSHAILEAMNVGQVGAA